MMKKFIAAFDGLKFSESTRDYAIYITRQSDAHLIGLFLEDLGYHSYRVYDLITEEGGNFETKRKRLDKKDEKQRAVSISNFENACKKAGISYSVHKDRNIAIQEILRESIYADLLIIDRNETLSIRDENAPTHFMHELLPDVQCPVLLVPSRYKPIDKLILLFDGEPTSVHAIKMLSYTIPDLGKLSATVVTVNPMRQKVHIPDSGLLKEFMNRHFPGSRYVSMKGIADSEIVQFLKKEKGNPLVVLGAYRRSRISRWFRPSMADILMKEFKFPLLIG